MELDIKKDCLNILECSEEDDFKKIYHKLSLQHHPDKGGDEEKFKKISKAYEILTNKDKMIEELEERKTKMIPELIEVFKDIRYYPIKSKMFKSKTFKELEKKIMLIRHEIDYLLRYFANKIDSYKFLEEINMLYEIEKDLYKRGENSNKLLEDLLEYDNKNPTILIISQIQ